jgi:hypothetical protein
LQGVEKLAQVTFGLERSCCEVELGKRRGEGSADRSDTVAAMCLIVLSLLRGACPAASRASPSTKLVQGHGRSFEAAISHTTST